MFDRLVADLEPRPEQAEVRRKTRRRRLRKPGAGPKHKLPLADRLLMWVVYYRTYTTHAFLGFLFGVDDRAVGRNINPLQPLLAGAFRIPERRVELAPDEIRELFFRRHRAAHSPPDSGPEAVLQREEEAAPGEAPGGGAEEESARPAGSAAAGPDRRRVRGVPRRNA